MDEVRRVQNLNQTSLSYIGKVQGEKGLPSLTESEIAGGFQTIWLGLDEALEKIKASARHTIVADYIVTRDTMILERARDLLRFFS